MKVPNHLHTSIEDLQYHLLEQLAKARGIHHLRIGKGLLILLDSLGDKPCNYDRPQDKKDLLFHKYFLAVQPAISAEQVNVAVEDLARDLRKKGHWIFQHIRHQEKVTVTQKNKVFEWFNGYYDNQGRRVEGEDHGVVRMTLTGQVFAIMSGLANSDEIHKVIGSVDHFLKDKQLGGVRLNTDFQKTPYLDLGRAFGFAYGTKENGAFFSHMTVMYAYGLYKRGFSRQGYDVLQSIYKMATDVKRSKIYPGIPEYFDAEGRGMYHYLTGSASWLILAELTLVFGVRGQGGDLVLAPQLVKEQFDRKGQASVSCPFAGQQLTIEYNNPKKLDAGQYIISAVTIDGKPVPVEDVCRSAVLIPRDQLQHSARINVLLDQVQ